MTHVLHTTRRYRHGTRSPYDFGKTVGNSLGNVQVLQCVRNFEKGDETALNAMWCAYKRARVDENGDKSDILIKCIV